MARTLMAQTLTARTIAFIGFGEAATAIVGGWNDPRRTIRAFDIKTDDPGTRPVLEDRYREFAVAGCETAEAAVAGADLVFSAVTADQAVAAATACAAHMPQGAYWFDLNSCAPSSKREAAALLEAAGARYVDVAVMAPVHPKRNLVPLLIAGPHAGDAAPLLESLPMAPRIVGDAVGAASSIKMIRSVMVKGMEALTAECLLAAVSAGVDQEVLASLQRSQPEIDWPGQAAYNLERMMVHGVRRAAEMREVARTVSDLGFPADMAAATVDWQQRIGTLGLRPEAGAGYPELAGALSARLRKG